MLRLALSRLGWLVPSLVGLSLVLLAVVELTVPLRAAHELPLALNVSPNDARARAKRAVREVVAGSTRAADAAQELGRLGSAALVHVLPDLPALGPAERARVVRALRPTAQRMAIRELQGLEGEAETEAWLRVWEDRRLELRPGPATGAVRRALRSGSAARLDELYALDTYALPVLFGEVAKAGLELSARQARLVAAAASSATGHDDRLSEHASDDEARRCMLRWRAYWAAHRLEFTTLDGPARLAASFLETKWAHALDDLFVRPIATPAELRNPEPLFALPASLLPSVMRTAAALMLVALLLVARATLGVTSGWWWASALPLVPLTLPLFPSLGEVAAVVGAAAFVTPLATSAVEALARRRGTQPFVAARARGASRLRAAWIDPVRPRLGGLAASAPTLFGVALSGVAMAEPLLGLEGIGTATARAITAGDGGWVYLVLLCVTGLGLLGRVGSELLGALTDPRLVRERARTSRGRR
jgi:peptide/nickel transport system permease protein